MLRLRRLALLVVALSLLVGTIGTGTGPVVAQDIGPGTISLGPLAADPEAVEGYSFLFIRYLVTLYRDGRGDTSLEQTIQNTGSGTVDRLTWSYNWYPGDYSNIYASDSNGSLPVTTYRTGTAIEVTIYFRHPLAPGEVYNFTVYNTIGYMAYVSGNSGQAYWYIGFPGDPQFVEGITFPTGTTFTGITPPPSAQGPNYLEWNSAPGGTLSINVYYTMSTPVVPDPFLELPIAYDGYSFDRAVSGRLAANQGLVTSWLDHSFPDYGTADNEITPWSGSSLPDYLKIDCTFGVNCYAGHNGIDWQHDTTVPQQPIYSAAAGKVVEKCTSRPCAGDRGAGYGQYVVIDHHNGYATLYAHLKSVSVAKDAEVPEHHQIGIMGDTGGMKAVHLHFGLYYDNSQNPTWPASKVVDPFGWKGAGVDIATTGNPAYQASRYMWKHPMASTKSIGAAGGQLLLPSKSLGATIPAGALDSAFTLDLFYSPVAEPSASLRSLGYTFRLQVTEWLGGNGPELASLGFNTPVTVSISYAQADLLHIPESSLKIRRWTGTAWVEHPTVLDTYNKVAYATTTQPGGFDLQGSLGCATDSFEPDDDATGATPLGSTVFNKSLDSAADIDWFIVTAHTAGRYSFRTSNLAPGVNTVLLMGDAYGNAVAYNDDGGGNGASLISITLAKGTYYLAVIPFSGTQVGCNATYRMSMTAPYTVYLPIVKK